MLYSLTYSRVIPRLESILIKLQMTQIFDHRAGVNILDPAPESPLLTAAEARRLMHEAIQDFVEDLPAPEINQLIDVFEERGLI